MCHEIILARRVRDCFLLVVECCFVGRVILVRRRFLKLSFLLRIIIASQESYCNPDLFADESTRHC